MNMINILKYLLPVIIFTAPCMGYAGYVYGTGNVKVCGATWDECAETCAYPNMIKNCSDFSLEEEGEFCCADSTANRIAVYCKCANSNYQVSKHDPRYPKDGGTGRGWTTSLSGDGYIITCDSGNDVCYCVNGAYGPPTGLTTNTCIRCPGTPTVPTEWGRLRTDASLSVILRESSITDCIVGQVKEMPDAFRNKLQDETGTFVYLDVCKYVKNGSGQ